MKSQFLVILGVNKEIGNYSVKAAGNERVCGKANRWVCVQSAACSCVEDTGFGQCKVLWRLGQVFHIKTDNEREDECKR